MIQFPCKCGYRFNLSDEWAGSLTQCPRCGRAMDVPTLADLPHLKPDGTLELEDLPPRPPESAVVSRMHRAFSPHTVDPFGNEKDLRGPIPADTDDDEELELAADPAPQRIAPRYDPITGELIRPLELKDDTPLPVLPVLPVDDDPNVPLEAIPVPEGAAPAPGLPRHLRAAGPIGYAAAATRPLNPASLALELLMPASATVLCFVFIAYLFAAFFGTLLTNLSQMFAAPLLVLDVPLWLIAAHYGCVIEETGPNALDELPRPLRNFSLSEDLINPLVWVALSVLICFLPAMLACAPRMGLDHNTKVLAALVLGLGGAFCFPAVLLTAVTGSTLSNLRPDRVIGVALSCGGEYLFSVGLLLLAASTGGLYLFPALANHLHLFDHQKLKHLQDLPVFLPLLFVSVYLGHYFCWHLGLLYRAHHDEFPWVLQRHVRTRRPVHPV